MTYIVGYDDNGRIAFAQASLEEEIFVPQGLSALEVTAGVYTLVLPHVGGERFYVSQEHGTVVGVDPRPSVYHSFDWATKTWQPDAVGGAELLREGIDRERARRHNLPITYAGAPFDADAEARENITGTLNRLVRGDGLPAEWMGWRDASNAMHWTEDTAAAVQTHLAGLSRALEDRKQALLIAAWTHKAIIAALPDIDAIVTYDLTVGWPA